MAERIRRLSLPLLVTLLLVGLATLLSVPPRGAQGAPFTVPTWVNNSPAPECRACGGCSCPGPAQFSPEGVHYATGDLVFDQPLFNVPGGPAGPPGPAHARRT
jgi:hypothetical protein